MMFRVCILPMPNGRVAFHGGGPLELFWEDFRTRRTFITNEAATVYLMRFNDREDD